MTTAAAEDAARTPFANRSGSQRQIAEGFTLVDRDGVSYRIKYWKIETVRHYPASGAGNGEEQVQFCTTDRFEFTLTGRNLDTLADDIHEKRAPPRLAMRLSRRKREIFYGGTTRAASRPRGFSFTDAHNGLIRV